MLSEEELHGAGGGGDCSLSYSLTHSLTLSCVKAVARRRHIDKAAITKLSKSCSSSVTGSAQSRRYVYVVTTVK